MGGILRDVFAMGARPIAVLDALRFGDPSDPRTRHLVDGVVRGVGGYGNCVGVPTVGGELVFDPSYQGNPLVNVMAIGLLEDGMLTRASADGPGNLVVLYGSATGRDGIGGASVLASARPSADQDPSKRPSVQVGDPFAEKLLIEATLELIAKGLVVGVQDLGAAGITCATCETADRGGTGMLVDLDAIPRREPGLEPFEVMISESQERMVAIVEPAQWDGRRDGLPALGPAGRDHRARHRGARHRRPHRARRARAPSTPMAGRSPARRELARIPAAALASEAIVFQRESRAPTRRRAAPAPGAPVEPVDALPLRGQDPGAVLLALLGSPNLSSRRAVYEQYDHNVQANTVAGPGRGAAVLRIKGTTKALVASTDANAPGRRARPVARRRAVGRGGRPQRRRSPAPGRSASRTASTSAIPTRPEAFWQLTEAVRGLSDACIALGLPVTGGNVSLYNESPGSAIAPTPEIGVVGLLDDVANARRAGVPRRRQRRCCWSGRPGPGLAGSEYARLAGAALDDGPPALDLAREARAPGVHPRGRSPAASSRAARTCPAAGSPWRWPRWRCGAAAGRRLRLAVGDSPGRRRCSARARRGLVVRGRAAPRPGLRSCSRASTGCRATSSAPPAARGWSSSSPAKAPRAPPRSAAAGSPTRSTSPSTTCATPGSTACHGRSAGRSSTAAMCGAVVMCGVVGVLPIAATRPRRSPRPRCSRSSTAARSRPGSGCPTAAT